MPIMIFLSPVALFLKYTIKIDNIKILQEQPFIISAELICASLLMVWTNLTRKVCEQ